MTPRYRITFTQEEREMVEAVTRCGKTNAPIFIQARALLLCDFPHTIEGNQSGRFCFGATAALRVQ